MSDPLSLAASITGIVAIGLHVTHVVTQFVGDTRSAPKSIQSLGVELEILCNILEQVRTMAQGCTVQAPVLQSHVLVQILEGVKVDFEDLSEILGAHTSIPSDGIFRQSWKQVRWVFRESEVADLRRSIEAYKSSLLLTLTFAKHSSDGPDQPTADKTLAEMAAIRKDLADVRALCLQLKNRNRLISRLVTSPSSLHQLPANASTASLTALTLIATNQTTASVRSAFSTRTTRSAGSTTNSGTSYWAASIIDLYCSELEEITAQTSLQVQVTSGTPNPQISSTVQTVTSQPASRSSQGESSNQPSLALLRLIRRIRPSHAISTWQFPFPQPTDETCVPVIMRTTVATDKKYHFDGMLFYPAPALVPAAFEPVPGRHATILEQDDYVRSCVESNAEFAIRESLRLLHIVSHSRNEMKSNLGIMKEFWRCYALYKIDPSCSAVRNFSSPPLTDISIELLRIYGFKVSNPEQGTPGWRKLEAEGSSVVSGVNMPESVED